MNKISLRDAAEDLEKICSEIENADQIDSALTKIFESAHDILGSSVDKRIRYLEYAETMIKQAKDMRDKWAARSRSLERSLEWLKTDTINLMKVHPTHQFKGELGGFKIQSNSVKTLDTDVKTKPKSFDVIDSTVGSELPSEYTTFVQVQVVNKDAIRSSLDRGIPVPGTKYYFGDHLRKVLEKK